MRVARFDRYILSQLMMLFGFFALVLVAIYWINSAVRLFDQLIADGQSAAVFLEYTALTLPNVIRQILPMAVFAAAVYVTNRLSSESELVVMQATGFSPWRLARPVLWFGLITALMMSMLTHLLVPMSHAEIERRDQEISQNVTARMLTEGTFLHPAAGITFYIRAIDADGTLHDVFLSDRRDSEEVQTFSAARAYLVNANEDPELPADPKLVMIDGLAQSLTLATNRLYTTHFQDFAYNLGALIDTSGAVRYGLRDLSTFELLLTPEEAALRTRSTPGRAIEEGNDRIAQALLCLVAALIGFSALQIGSFSRFGVWRQIIFAILLLVVVKFVEGNVTDTVRRDGTLWPLLYLPSATGMVISILLLWWAGRARRPRRPRGDAGLGAAA